MNRAPMSDNPRARALIIASEVRCMGCRTNWRLKTGTFKHAGTNSDCRAVVYRRELREIAAQNKETT